MPNSVYSNESSALVRYVRLCPAKWPVSDRCGQFKGWSTALCRRQPPAVRSNELANSSIGDVPAPLTTLCLKKTGHAYYVS